MAEYVSFLSEKEQAEKDLMLEKLEKSYQQLWHKLEEVNEILSQLRQIGDDVNKDIANVNNWIREIRSSKSEEIEQMAESEDKRTKTNELYCYSDLKKFRFSTPSPIDLNQVIDEIRRIIVEFDEMP